MAMPNIDDVARQVVELHFHPDDGSPYWLDRAGRLDQDPLLSVKNFEDFRRIVGFRDEEDQRHFEVATRTEPVERFVPASVLRNERWFWPTQTGGTTGDAKHGVWFDRSWQRILGFADRVLNAYEVPQNVNWLVIGPTGPHGRGRIGNTIAEVSGGGPASFTFEMCRRGYRAVAVDPLYELARSVIAERIDRARQSVLQGLIKARDRFVWEF